MSGDVPGREPGGQEASVPASFELTEGDLAPHLERIGAETLKARMMLLPLPGEATRVPVDPEEHEEVWAALHNLSGRLDGLELAGAWRQRLDTRLAAVELVLKGHLGGRVSGGQSPTTASVILAARAIEKYLTED